MTAEFKYSLEVSAIFPVSLFIVKHYLIYVRQFCKSPTAVFREQGAGWTDVIRQAELLWPSEILNGNTTHAQLRAAGHWEANGGAVLRGVLSDLSCTPTVREW